MRDQGDAAVVVLGGHPHRHRAEVQREVLDDAELRGGVRVGRGDHPGAAEEQVGARRDGAAAFPAGERMRADVAGEVGAAARSAASGAAFTLATSVTRARGCAASSARTTSAVTSGGTATTTSADRPAVAAARPAP